MAPFSAENDHVKLERHNLVGKPSLLQFGHNQINEVLESAGEIGRHNDKPLGQPGYESLFENVSNALRRAVDDPMTARRRSHIVAQRRCRRCSRI